MYCVEQGYQGYRVQSVQLLYQKYLPGLSETPFYKQSLSPACICADILSCVRREGPVGICTSVGVRGDNVLCREGVRGYGRVTQVPGQKGLELSSVNYRVTILH